MAKIKSKNKIKMAVGYTLIGLSLVLLALSCIPNFIVANCFKGVFGVAWYAYLVLGMLFGFANILELRYVYSKKFTVCVFFLMFALISILHVIFTHSAMVNYEGFANFNDYINYCYSMADGITVGGVVFGAVTYFFKTIFGIVGVYAVFVMMLAIFSGIVLDSLIYGTSKGKKRQVLDLASEQNQAQNTTQTQASFVNINQGRMQTEQGEDDDFADDNTEFVNQNFNTTNFNFNTDDDFDSSASVTSTNRQTARDRLFPERDFTNYNSRQPQQNQSARDILFGQRDIPDVTMANDSQRDRWMRNTGRELNQEPDVSVDDDINDIFGNTSLEDNDNASSDLYTRGFGVRPVINSMDEDDQEEVSNSRFGNVRNSRISRMEQDNNDFLNRRTPDRNVTASRGLFGNSGFGKLGEDTEDVAKPQEIDFTDNAPKPATRSTAKVQGKQIGIKSVRYNSIPLSTFKVYKEANADYSEEYRRKSAALEKVMNDFRIGARVINVVRGPKVTRYELTLPDGVSVNKVLSIETDIAIALEAKSKIRIEPHIPGKKAFGIELANDNPSTVGMRELLESPEFTNTTHPLPIAIGKDIDGAVIIKSLPKMIHLLVAGSSGSGKSVFIHSLMMSILYKYSPDEVRFIMIDPKRVEFTMYKNLPHLMLPDVVSDHDKALNSIKWAVQEMEKRYVLLQTTECQNIEQYNKLPEVTSGKETKMPYLIIVVDELAELMGGALKKDFEAGIQRITQLGRAAGIHMVVATQRPSVDVVTGTIKNNMPTRVAFSLASFADSKTVLDEGGAENLLGQGDMLFAPQDMNNKVRLQAAFCSNDEIRAALKYVKENNEAHYDEEIIKEIYAEKKEEPTEGTDALGNGGASPADNSMDDLMKPVVKYARSIGKISSSMLQRKFRIGFNRAARIVFELEELGFVGPQVGAKPRDFIMSDEQFAELFGEDDDDSIF